MEPSPDTEMHISDERVIKIKTMDGQTLTMTVDADVNFHPYPRRLSKHSSKRSPLNLDSSLANKDSSTKLSK